MAKNGESSNFINNIENYLTIFQKIVILGFLLTLIFRTEWVTPILKKIGQSLQKAGFTEATFLGFKQDLTKIDNKIQETDLNTEQAQESLTKAIKILEGAKEKSVDSRITGNIEKALSLIALSQIQVGFAKKQIQEAKSITERTTNISNPRPLSDNNWIVVVSADKTPKSAQDEVNRSKNNGFKNAKILFRENQYRTVIPFATQQEADDNLPNIRRKIRQGSYLRNINKWCTSLEPAKADDIAFEKCNLPK
jgi:hypothetical protein